eukprot:6977811-Prorocentrum_lima.AAC.1
MGSGLLLCSLVVAVVCVHAIGARIHVGVVGSPCDFGRVPGMVVCVLSCLGGSHGSCELAAVLRSF